MPQLVFLKQFLRVLWVVLGVGLTLWIVQKNLPPGGRLIARMPAGEPSGFIGGLTPGDRVALAEENGRRYFALTDEPAYFRLARPRFFRQAVVRLHYRHDGEPLIELGARVSRERWQFDLRPVDAALLDGLGWSARQDGRYRVYEKKPTGRTAAEILRAADARKTAVYHLDPVRWGMTVPGAVDRGAELECQLSTVNCQKLYIYAARPPFQASIDIVGKATVKLVKDGETILTRAAADETVELAVTNAKPGLYRLEIDAAEGGASRVRTANAILAAAGQPPKPPVFFQPEFPSINAETRVAEAGYDTIVADYVPPKIGADGWKTSEAEFDLGTLAAEGGGVQMIVSVPGIKAVGRPVLIDWIEVEYRRPPLLETLKSWL